MLTNPAQTITGVPAGVRRLFDRVKLVGSTHGPWLYGALINHQWSFAGWGKKDVSETTIQPFLNYNFGKGFAVGTNPIITADWEADSRDRWTVPLGLGVSQVLKLGPLPVKFGLSAYYNVERPRFGSDWQLQFQVTFLFPK